METTNSIIMLKKMLDVCSLRHQVLANNLANINTPGYIRRDVSFTDSLKNAIEKGSNSNLMSLSPEIETDTSAPVNANGNNVTTQSELGEIAENSLMYGVAVRALSSKYESIKKAISSK